MHKLNGLIAFTLTLALDSFCKQVSSNVPDLTLIPCALIPLCSVHASVSLDPSVVMTVYGWRDDVARGVCGVQQK